MWESHLKWSDMDFIIMLGKAKNYSKNIRWGKITNTKIKSSVDEFKSALDTAKEMHFELEDKAKEKK